MTFYRFDSGIIGRDQLSTTNCGTGRWSRKGAESYGYVGEYHGDRGGVESTKPKVRPYVQQTSLRSLVNYVDFLFREIRLATHGPILIREL